MMMSFELTIMNERKMYDTTGLNISSRRAKSYRNVGFVKKEEKKSRT